METPKTNPSGLAPGGPQPPPPGSVGVGAPPATSEEQRARWRDKAKLAYQRRKARERGEAPPVALAGAAAAPAGDPAPAPGDPPPVPWDPALLRPLFETTIAEVEKLDIASLTAKAARIDADLAKEVAKDAPWNPVAKATILTTGPEVAAKALTAMAIPAEHAPAVALAAAIVAIFSGRQRLDSKLDQLLKAKADEKESNAPGLQRP